MEFSNYSIANVEYLIAKIAQGRTVQFKFRELTEWTDYVPGSYEGAFSVANANSWCGYTWRVKPELQKMSYELYLVKNKQGVIYLTTSHALNSDVETIIKTIEQKEIEYEVE